jgi:AcrR family transcriptional regulator
MQVTALDDVGATLLEAAGRILASDGAAALTVRRIAADAGMSTMNVYSRFGSKQGVVEQLFLRGFALLTEAMTEVTHSDDPLADLRACGEAYRRFALTHQTLYAVMFHGAVPDYEPSPLAYQTGAATLQELADRIQRAIDARLLRRTDAGHAAAIVWSTCHGVLSLEMKKSSMPMDWAAIYRDACENVIRGLAA